MALLKRTAAVTGAFSYSGQHIARRLLEAGWEVITLTRNPGRQHTLQEKIKAFPLDFTNLRQLSDSLRGVDTLVNTYWVRFDYPGSSFAQAIENTAALLHAAEAAGVQRFIHLSVSNPSPDSDLPYYRGKAAVESLIKESKLSYSILRPTIIFGKEEVLINNITWLLRHLPLFVIPGNGNYRVQPIYVDDLADLVVKATRSRENEIINAAGPEVFTYNELIRLLLKVTDSHTLVFHAPPSLALSMSKMLGFFLGDVMLTKAELLGLLQDRLYVGEPATGTTKFSIWAQENADLLGRHYVNELKRHHGKGDD